MDIVWSRLNGQSEQMVLYYIYWYRNCGLARRQRKFETGKTDNVLKKYCYEILHWFYWTI